MAGHTLDELNAQTIISIEHFIGPAALSYGVGPEREVVLIATRDTATAERMTWPQAATPQPGALEGLATFINGTPLARGHTLAELNVQTISGVDVLKGAAARLLFGAGAGAILVTTTDTVTAARITRP